MIVEKIKHGTTNLYYIKVACISYNLTKISRILSIKPLKSLNNYEIYITGMF